MDDAEEAVRSVRAAPQSRCEVNKPSISVVSPKSRWVHACYPSETMLLYPTRARETRTIHADRDLVPMIRGENVPASPVALFQLGGRNKA
jgi:hypothetical protein